MSGPGVPLIHPKPPGNLPAQYRRKGVAIGDVGTVTAEGVFDFFFNIYLPADDPINEDIPEDFVALPPYREKDVIYDHIDPGDYVASPSIHEIGDDFSEPETGGNFVFDCQGPNGAVLALPHGARAEKLRNLENVRQYATRHAESWYKYANKTRGRGLVNGSLYLVTGCEKARSWGMASFHNVSLPGENGFSLSFKPTTDANNGYRYRWKAPIAAASKRIQLELVSIRLPSFTPSRFPSVKQSGEVFLEVLKFLRSWTHRHFLQCRVVILYHMDLKEHLSYYRSSEAAQAVEAKATLVGHLLTRM
ncbi:hypothetical protein K438DRAFT_1641830 [Mycena galopus ATCC 62051]|nr:hypothetical protein K438DRAFT_1641830 [Mycena galopus ATCC 62051]